MYFFKFCFDFRRSATDSSRSIGMQNFGGSSISSRKYKQREKLSAGYWRSTCSNYPWLIVEGMLFKVIFIFSLMFWYCFPGLWSSMHGVVGVVVIIYQLCLSECGECVRVIFVMAEYKQIILLIIDCRMRDDSWRCCAAGLQDCVGAAHM